MLVCPTHLLCPVSKRKILFYHHSVGLLSLTLRRFSVVFCQCLCVAYISPPRYLYMYRVSHISYTFHYLFARLVFSSLPTTLQCLHCWQRQLCLWDELLLIVCFACCFVFTLLLFHFWSLLCAGAGCHFQALLLCGRGVWFDQIMSFVICCCCCWCVVIQCSCCWSVPTRACLSFCHIHCLYDASQCQRKSVRVDHYAP